MQNTTIPTTNINPNLNSEQLSQLFPLPSTQTFQSPELNQNNSSSNFKTYIFIFLGLLMLALFASSYAGYRYMLPRLNLATAISNLIEEDSFRVETEVLLKDNIRINISSDYQSDPSILQKRETVIYTPTEGQEILFSDLIIENQTDQYLKFKHSHMNQMYNYLLTINPELNENPHFKAIEPILHSGSWLHKKNVIPTHPDDSTLPTKSVIFLGLMSFSSQEYDPLVEIDGRTYARHTMGFTSLASELLMGLINATQLDLTLAQSEEIRNIISNSENLENSQVVFFIDNQSGYLSSVNIYFSAGLISELEKNSQVSSDSTSVGDVLNGPLKLISWLNQDATKPNLTMSFSDVGLVSAPVPPNSIIDSEKNSEAFEVMGYLYYSFTDLEFIGQAIGPDNAYITLTHESKLLFNQGNYAEGLQKATQAFNQASTAEHRAFASYWMGLHHHKLGNNSEAETRLLAAVSMKNDYAAPYVTLGSISLGKSNYQSMLEYSQKCIEIDPTYAWCHNNLGIALVSLGQKQAGITAIEKAVSLDPTSFVFNDNLKRARDSN